MHRVDWHFCWLWVQWWAGCPSWWWWLILTRWRNLATKRVNQFGFCALLFDVCLLFFFFVISVCLLQVDVLSVGCCISCTVQYEWKKDVMIVIHNISILSLSLNSSIHICQSTFLNPHRFALSYTIKRLNRKVQSTIPIRFNKSVPSLLQEDKNNPTN